MPLSNCEKASEPESLNFTGTARSQFHGLAGRRMAHCFGARELRMSEGPTSATRRQKKSWNLAASPSHSGKDEIRISCPMLTKFVPAVSAKLERTSRSTAKERGHHQPPVPQPSLLGLLKCGGHDQSVPSGKYPQHKQAPANYLPTPVGISASP
jgi:hypothetical protein